MIKINGKVAKIGNGYHLLIPKALVKCKVLQEGKKYDFVVEEETGGLPIRTYDHLYTTKYYSNNSLLPFENMLGVRE